MYTHNECVVVYRRVLNAGSSAAVGRILTLGGATVESTQNAPREIVTSVSTTRGDGRVLDQLHKIPSQIDVVSGTCHRRK